MAARIRHEAMAPPLALPPGVSPQCRRVRAEGPLSQETLDACVAKFLRSPGFKANSPIVATFATSVHDPWLLGLSAAKLGLPVVIAGLGRSFPSHFSWWLGYAKKFPGSVRAAQVLRALAPRAPVIWVDSTDTVLVNPVVGSAARAISDVLESSAGGRSRVLVGAECWSWPRCYADDYGRDPEHQRCMTSSHACYPNAGAYLATSDAMYHFLAAHNETWQAFLGTGISNAECTHDQAALQHIVLNRTRARYAHLDVRLDSATSFFFNMHECKGPAIKIRNLSMCYHRKHTPLDHARYERHGNRSALWFKPGLVPPEAALPRRRMRHEWSRPLIAHAAGDHRVLTDSPFFEPLRAELRLEQEAAALRNYPVLLVDPAAGGVCTTSSIGEAYGVRTGNGGRRPLAAAARPKPRKPASRVRRGRGGTG